MAYTAFEESIDRFAHCDLSRNGRSRIWQECKLHHVCLSHLRAQLPFCYPDQDSKILAIKTKHPSYHLLLFTLICDVFSCTALQVNCRFSRLCFRDGGGGCCSTSNVSSRFGFLGTGGGVLGGGMICSGGVVARSTAMARQVVLTCSSLHARFILLGLISSRIVMYRLL